MERAKQPPDISRPLRSKKRKERITSKSQIFRRLVQLGIAGLIIFLIVQRFVVGENGSISTVSPEAFCPFGGLETLYQYLTGGGTFISHAHLSNIVMLIAVLAVALLFRSAFCGWICPLGFFQDVFNLLSRSLQKQIPFFKRLISTIKINGTGLEFFDRYLRYLKYLVLIWAVGGAAIWGVMVFRDFDPWSAFLNILEFSFTPGLIVLLITFIGSFFIERPWCRYACPLGAISGLLGIFSPTFIKRNPDTCISCKLCTKSCPMGLQVHNVNAMKNVNCISCLECVSSCPVKGTLEVKIGTPIVGK